MVLTRVKSAKNAKTSTKMCCGTTQKTQNKLIYTPIDAELNSTQDSTFKKILIIKMKNCFRVKLNEINFKNFLSLIYRDFSMCNNNNM